MPDGTEQTADRIDAADPAGHSEPDVEDDDDPCAVGDHSYEYLYSVYSCNNCDHISEE